MLSTPQSSPNLAVKKSNEYKLVSYEIRFPDLYFSPVKNGWVCKICFSLPQGIASNRAFIDKPRIFGLGFQITLIQITKTYLWKASNDLKKYLIEMPISGKWHLMHLYNLVKLSVKIIVLFWNASLKQQFCWSGKTGHIVIILEIL